MSKIRSKILLNLIIPVLDIFLKTKICYYLNLITKMNTWTSLQVKNWQNKKVQELVSHFYENTVYYKQLFDKHNILVNDIRTVEDLKKIPPITKKEIRENYDSLIPVNINNLKHKKASTGGSTGNPLKFLLDIRSWSYTTAIKIFSWQTTSYRYGDRYAAIGSSSLFPTNKKSWKHIFYFFLRQGIPLNGMNLSDEKLTEFVKILKEKKVKYLYGYASSIYLLARFVKKNNFELDIKGCFPTSEILTDTYRKEIVEAFNCFVMDTYGARDGGTTAYEINPGYYNVGHNSYAELINCYEKDTGTLLVTDLLNFAFPFIRYKIGDEATMPTNLSNFNYNGQVFTKIFGRISDVIRLENGRVLTGPGFTILFKDLNVIAYRIKQINGKKIRLDIQKGPNYTVKEEKAIIGTCKKHAGNDCEIEISYVANFQTKQNEKRDYFMSN